MSYNVIKISKYIIYYEYQCGRYVNNLRLQRLLYFVWAKYLIEKQRPLFEERMEAWNSGPVVPKAYREYRYYGLVNIPCEDSFNTFSIREEDKDIINSMLDSCSEYSTCTLMDIIHGQEPWIRAHRSYDKIITPFAIYHYFSEKQI